MYDKKVLDKVMQLGTLGYPLSKALNVLDLEEGLVDQFQRDFECPDTVIYKQYQKGVDKSDFLIDAKLFEMAKNGDLKAVEKYEQRKKLNIYNSKKR